MNTFLEINAAYDIDMDILTPLGHTDSNPWYRSYEGVVPGNPWEAARLKHHGFGKQQHCGHARWIFPCM